MSSSALHTPSQQQQPIAIVATPVGTVDPSITPTTQAALTKFVTPKMKTPQQLSVLGSGNIKICQPGCDSSLAAVYL